MMCDTKERRHEFALSLGLHRTLFKQRNKRLLLSLLTWWCHLEWRTPHATEASMPSSHSSKASLDVWIFSAFCFFSSHYKIGTSQQVVWKTNWIFKKVLLCYLDALVGNKRRSKRLGPLKLWNLNGVHHVALSAAQQNQPNSAAVAFQVVCTLMHEPAF